MRNRSPLQTAAVALVVILAGFSGPLGAATIAKIKNIGEALVFTGVVDAQRWTLTVAGPCGFHYQTTGRASELAFRLGDETLDGTYTFALEATRRIDPEVREILLKARATGDNGRVFDLCREGRLPDPTQTQSGSFTVLERQIVFDATPEAQSKTDRDSLESAARPSQDTQEGEGVSLASVGEAPSTGPQIAALAPSNAGCEWARMAPGAGVAER